MCNFRNLFHTRIYLTGFYTCSARPFVPIVSAFFYLITRTQSAFKLNC